MQLQILDINVCDLFITYIPRHIRIKYLSTHLSKQKYDVISMQELFTARSYNALKNALSDKYYIFPKDIKLLNFNGGLVTFLRKSTFTIDQYNFYKFTDTGRKRQISILPDRFIKKGFHSIRCQTRDGVKLTFINAHLFMNYGKSKAENNMLANQLKQMNEEVISLQSKKYNILCCGDFNIEPENMDMQNFLMKTNLIDTLHYSNKCTISPLNINRKFFGKYKHAASRCDYILYSNPLVLLKSDVIFDEYVTHENRQIMVSDHFGVESIIEI